MTTIMEFNTLLVPVDFSPASENAFRRAQDMVVGENPVLILLHVIDPSLIDVTVAHGWGTGDEVAERMRKRAQDGLEAYRQSAGEGVEVDAFISEGIPFLEILRKADDFAVDAIVIGKVGTRGPIEKMLFGSTAEKVLRGSRRPVIVLPDLE